MNPDPMPYRTGALAAAFAVALLAAPAVADDQAASQQEPFKRMTVEEVEKALGQADVHVYDGNSKSTYRKGHVPGAVNLYTKDMKPGVLPAKKDATLVFYCQNEL